MKQLLLILFSLILLPALWVNPLQAQDLEFVRPADFRYHITVDGDTLSTRSLEYKALQDGIMFKYQYPNSNVVIQPTGIEIRGSFPVINEPQETITDTVYVESEPITVTETITDTVFVDKTDTLFVDRVDTTFIDRVDTTFIDRTDTLFVDRVDTTFIDRTDTLFVDRVDTVFVDRVDTVFSDTLVVRSKTYETDFSSFNPDEWEQTWGELEFEHDSLNNELRVTLPNRSIARLQWNKIPEHTNAEYIIVEQIDSTHSTGFHVGLRTSETTPMNSVETYLHGDGVGISIFNDGSWSNPISYIADWNYGETWITHGKLQGDVFKVRSYRDGTPFEDLPDWNVYQSDDIGAVPSGRFALGSTGAGDYILKALSVTITDAEYIDRVDTTFVERTDTLFVDRVDTTFIDRTDTLFVDRVDTLTVTDTLFVDRVDTVTVYEDRVDTVTVTDAVTDTLYTNMVDTVYVDSLTGTYFPPNFKENQNRLLHNIQRSYRRDSLGNPEITYTWESEESASDIHWRCVVQDIEMETYPLWKAEGHGTLAVIANPYTTYSRTITPNCSEYLHVYIVAQDLATYGSGDWSLRYDDYVNISEVDSLYMLNQNQE